MPGGVKWRWRAVEGQWRLVEDRRHRRVPGTTARSGNASDSAGRSELATRLLPV